jgi:hypothetical protein
MGGKPDIEQSGRIAGLRGVVGGALAAMLLILNARG